MKNEKYTPKLCGRRVLCATQPKTLDKDSVAAILNDVLPYHYENVCDITYLHDFVRGDQPILRRVKEVRPEIKNIVVENRAFEIVKFKRDYTFSHPIQYTNSSTNDALPIDLINTYARLDGKAAKDLALMEWMCTSGNGYRITLPNIGFTEDEAPYYSAVLDPREGFIVYSCDVHRRPIMAGTIVKQKDAKTDKETYDCAVYTKKSKYEWRNVDCFANFATTTPEETPNIYGLIPIVEYRLNDNRIGYVELCHSLFNSVNTLDSNRIDALEQFVQSYLVFLGCDVPKDENGNPNIKQGDVILIPPNQNNSGNMDVKFIVAQLDQAQTQISKEDLLQSINEICFAPDRQGRNTGGGDTGQAVSLRNGWGTAEADAKATCQMFAPSEHEHLKIVLAICRKADGVDLEGMTLGDIGIAFSRNHSDNLLVKAQALEILIRSGMNEEDATEVVGLVNDPSAVVAKNRAQREAGASVLQK